MDIFELRREIMHMMVGALFLLIVILFPKPFGEMFLFIVLLLGGLVSFLSTKFHLPLISSCLELFERKDNGKFPGKGVLFFFIGSLIVLQLFPRDIAFSSIIILTFSDPISHFVGSNFGKLPGINKRKYIEGTLAGILIGGLLASLIVNPLLAFIGAFVAMFLEAAEIAMAGKNVDDNLLIPIVAGTVMYLLRLRFF
ncbi:MAG: diacylglycerol/polyprenol kinase family protein [Candidatus Nanoarchaeia archaeon]